MYNVPASDSISNYVVVHFISVCALIGILLRSIGHDDSSSIVGRIRTIVGAVGWRAGRKPSLCHQERELERPAAVAS